MEIFQEWFKIESKIQTSKLILLTIFQITLYITKTTNKRQKKKKEPFYIRIIHGLIRSEGEILLNQFVQWKNAYTKCIIFFSFKYFYRVLTCRKVTQQTVSTCSMTSHYFLSERRRKSSKHEEIFPVLHSLAQSLVHQKCPWFLGWLRVVTTRFIEATHCWLL